MAELEQQLASVRQRVVVLGIEAKVIAERRVRMDGDFALLSEEMGRISAELVRVKLELNDA